jgi:uncharacterized membrane protein
MRENRNNSYLERENEGSLANHDLIKKEQEYRHKWQDKFIKSNILTFRLGQLFGLAYNLALLYLVYILIQDGEKSLALKIFISNLALIAFAVLVTGVERKVLSRKPTRKGRDGKNFKPRGARNDRSRDDRR